ncbi:MAG: YdeI family protein, partial [Candidatus Aminicenantaceae bacterium]
MEIGKTLYVTGREDWRDWLARNHASEEEVWLIYYRKSTGKPRIPYNDAVEEALCFGWIDSQQKGMDVERFAQR